MGTGANVERLHIRLFLEGVEIPVIAATVNCSMNSPVSAQFEIVPTDAALRFKPRTTVHAFFLDTSDPNYIADEATGLLPAGPDIYKLLFCGEVFDIVFSKSGAGSRSIVLNCLDFSSLWDTTYIYLLRFATGVGETSSRNIISGSQAVFLGAPELLDDTGVNSPQQLIARLASQRKFASNPAFNGVTDNIGGLLAVLELIGGIPGATLGLYDWQTVQERRVRLMDQIGTDSGRTAAKIFDQTVLEEWLVNSLGQSGEYISFREIIEQIMAYVYYGVAPQAVAIYRNGTRAVPQYLYPTQPPPTTGASANRRLVNVDPDMITAYYELERIMREKYGWGNGTKPPMEITSANGGNHAAHSYHYFGLAVDVRPVGFALGGFSFMNGSINGPTGSLSTYLMNPQAHTGWNFARTLARESNIRTKEELERQLDTHGMKDKFLTTVNFFLDLGKAVNHFNALNIPAVSSRARKSYIQMKWGNDFKSQSVDPALSLYGLNGDIVHIELSPSHNREAGVGASASPPQNGTESTSGTENAVSPAESVAYAEPAPNSKVAKLPRQRMYTQIFRPDCWFVAPPMCNVIFPEEYTSFSFRRQMMREITRLELDTFNLMLNDALLRTVYFAPRIKGFDSLTSSGNTANKRLVYLHERFSGVIPKTEQMPDLPFYAKKEIVEQVSEFTSTTDITRAAVVVNKTPDAYTGEASNLIERFASRAVTFHFLSYRYAARSMSVSGRFMPRLVLGFPGAVIDRPSTARELRPIHHLGMVTSVQHSINQSGGFTFVSFSHARSHRTQKNEIDDLFAEYAGGTVFDVQDQVTSGFFDTVYTGGNALPGDDYESWQINLDSWIRNQIKVVRTKNGEIEQRNAINEAQRRAAGGNPPAPEPEYPTSVPGAEVPNLAESPIPEPTSWSEVQLRGTSLVGPNGKRLLRVSIQGEAPVETIIEMQVDENGDPSYDDAGEIIYTERPSTPDPSRPFSKVLFDEATKEDAPLEDSIRPPWFDDEYSNDNIDELYKKLLGCTSILKKGKNGVEAALDSLVSQYSAVTQSEGRALTSVIDMMTRRDMASLRQVLLTPGNKNDPANSPEAFHFYTVGDWKNFDGLLLRNVKDEFGKDVKMRTSLLGTSTSGQERDIFSTPDIDYLDVRIDRRQPVLTYMNELFSKRGLRG